MPLVIDVRPSYTLAALFIALHMGALATLAATPLHLALQAVLATAIGASALHTLRRHALLSARGAIVRLSADAQGEWTLHRRDGKIICARLLPGSYVHPVLTVLNFELSYWRRCSVLLIRGRVDSNVFRRLRVMLAGQSSQA